MKFHATSLDGARLIEFDLLRDNRGYFARTFCEVEYAEQGLVSRFVQHSTSFSKSKGTVRGMHFQEAPHSEVKIVRCLRGAIYDVIVDLRRDSPSYLKWEGFELSPENARHLYVPKGFAHGFQTLADDVEVSYLISEFHSGAASSGVRFDDSAFGIRWPLPVTEMSDRDRSWPDYT